MNRFLFLLQDFNYVMSNAFDITLELSCCKHVPSNELQREWFKNKEAMLSYMEATHLGVRGFVLDEDRQVVPGATVRVKGINKGIRTTSDGEYWRLLVPGRSYAIYATAKGFEDSDEHIVHVVQGKGMAFQSITMRRKSNKRDAPPQEIVDAHRVTAQEEQTRDDLKSQWNPFAGFFGPES